MLDSLPTSSSSSSSSSTATNTPVNVTFKTTPSINTTFPSSLSRELFFASHHSLHHLSSVKIALTSMGVGAASDLGKAPSTVAHESSSDDSPSSDDDSPLIYHTAWFCPFAHRCTLALSHHSLPHTPVESLGWSKRPSSDGQTTHDHWYHYKNPDLLAANPLGMVPTLVQGSKVCTESLACIDFVDAMGEGTSLIPSDPWEAARCRVWSEKVSDAGLRVCEERSDETERACVRVSNVSWTPPPLLLASLVASRRSQKTCAPRTTRSSSTRTPTCRRRPSRG